MTGDQANVLRRALRLPAGARAALAGRLLESLDARVDEDAEAEWAAEIARRAAEIDAASVAMVPWAEVRRRLRAAAHGPKGR